jgi:hypothetical protein
VSPYRAYALVSGMEEPDDEGELIDAAQYMVDSGQVYNAPGDVGRNVEAILS